jgi:outer membrane protein TolC
METSIKQTEVSLYQLKEIINSVFFSILLFQEQVKILMLMDEILEERISVAESALENGVMMESDLLSLRAEQLKLKQQITEIEINRESGFSVLGELLEMDLEMDTEFTIPEYNLDPTGQITRPEIGLFESQITQIGFNDQLLKATRRPKIYAFSQVGYGRPGLNMLSDEFDPYYLVGAKISWNPFDWRQSKRNREVLQLQQSKVSNQMESFRRNVSIELERANSEIMKFKKLMSMDEEIIVMRSNIVSASTSKLENGIIHTADYLSDLNSEKQARIDREIHRMMLLKAQADYHVIKGM